VIVLIGGGLTRSQARDIRESKEMVVRRAERDPEFRREMLKTGVELLLSGDPADAAIGREKLRTYIDATIGFERLAAELDKSPRSLMLPDDPVHRV
jgi:hypothetical protein